MGTKTLLGLAQGVRAEDELLRNHRIQDEDRARRISREDAADKFRAEDRAYELSQRPAREEIQRSQLEDMRSRRQQAAAALEAEGLADLLDSLKAGADPKSALLMYNARGGHKINPDTFRYDGQNIGFTREDGEQVNVNADALRGEVDRALRASTAPKVEPKVTKYKDDEIAFGPDGKVVFRGPKYGRTTPEKDRPLMNVGGQIYDPNTKQWISPPEDAAGGKGGGNGFKESTFNLGSAQKDAREVLAKAIGVKTDRDGNPTEHNESWLDMSAMTDAMVGQYRRELGAAEIARTIATTFKDMPTREERIEAWKKENEPQVIAGRWPFTSKESPADYESRAREAVDAAYQTEFQARSKAAEKAVASLARASATRNSPAAVTARSMPQSLQDKIVPGKVRKIRNPLTKEVELWTRGPDGELQQVDEAGRPTQVE